MAVGSSGRSAPPWKRPIFRILLLGAFGVLVYLKFDVFVRSQALKSLQHPEKIWRLVLDRMHLQSEEAAPAAALATGDSTSMRLDCATADAESCLRSWKFLDEETRGLVRALLLKARLAAGAAPTGFGVTLRKDAADPGEAVTGRLDSVLWSVSRLDLKNGGRIRSLLPKADRDGRVRYCLDGECPDEVPPLAPFGKFTPVDHGEKRELWLRPLENPSVLCMLPGRILEVTADGEGLRGIKVYHGDNLVSEYRGLKALGAGLAVGSRVNAGATLGVVDAVSGTLKVRIEKDGVAEDAAAFLGLQDRLSVAAETPEANHGR